MGGQTALNLCIEADEKGIWEDFGVKLIGVDINAIEITEDREQFKNLMNEIGVARRHPELPHLIWKEKKLHRNLDSRW